MEKDQVKNMDSFKIFKAGLKAVSGYDAVLKHLKRKRKVLFVENKKFNLDNFKNVYVLGGGKAAGAMAKALENILGDKITNGLISVKYGHKTAGLREIKQIEAGHPIPDENGEKTTQKIEEILKKSDKDDLVFFLNTGGISALLPDQVVSLTLDDLKKATEFLIKSGADISEINTVRKHLSRLKGGQMAELSYPSVVVNLIISDVIGDDLSTIGSGFVVPDTTTFSDCEEILKKYHLWDKMPKNVIKRIDDGIKGKVKETPKPNDKIFKNVHNILVATNEKALYACKKKAKKLGYKTNILTDKLSGEAKEKAKIFIDLAKKGGSGKCIIFGGETVVTVKGNGLGGRNTEMALAVAIGIENLKGVEFLSCGTDGTDGPTDAAGAICDGETISKAKKLGLDPKKYLENKDSYHFFEKVGGLVKTGPTNTNVNDVQVLLIRDK